MKYITCSWGEEYDGVLFFVQRLQEMLFHYSDDIVKAPVHNSATLINEYLKVSQDSTVPKYHLKSIASELEKSLQKDCIVKMYLGDDNVERVIAELKIDESNTIKYLYSALPFGVYYKKTCEYLLEKIKKPKEKEEIEFALRIWIASVAYGGYRFEYIYRYLNETFSNIEEDIYKITNNFIERFDFKKKEHIVYLNFYKSMDSYKELLSHRLNVVFKDDGNFEKLRNQKNTNKSFVGKLIIEELDSYGAIAAAHRQLDIFFSFYRVLSNRRIQLLGKNGLVVCGKEEMRLPVVTDGYKAIALEPHIDLKFFVDSMVIGCPKKDKNTYIHLQKMIRLHNMALIQSDLSEVMRL